MTVPFPVEMMIAPSFNSSGTFGCSKSTFGSLSQDGNGTSSRESGVNIAITGGTVGFGDHLFASNDTAAYLEFTAEL